MDLNKKVKVWNRSSANACYYIEEMRMLREFAPAGNHGDALLIPVAELQALTYIQGGHSMLTQDLLIKDQEVCDFLGIPTEPEYYYGVEEVRKLLKEGSIEQLMDCLEFAPSGVKDLIVKYSIEDKLDSHEKRDLINKTMGINLTAMIRNNDLSEIEPNNGGNAPQPNGRRAQPIKTTEQQEEPQPQVVRKYNVVNRK